MNLLNAWAWRRAMKPSVAAVHHPSLRLPRKICGLFDKGFAGDILDVTSMDSDAPAASSFSPGLDFADSALFDSLLCGNNDVSEELFNSLPPHLISSLNSLEEHVITDLSATDSLDAFLNLDKMLDQDMLFDEYVDINLLKANTSLDKMIYSLFGSESFSSKQTTLPDVYSLGTAAKDVCIEPIIPSLFEKQMFDSLLMTSTYSPDLHPGHSVSLHPGNAVSLHPGNTVSLHLGNAVSLHLGNAVSLHPGNAVSLHPGNAVSLHPCNAVSLHPGNTINLDHKKDATFECVQKPGTGFGNKIRSNLLSLETTACSNNIDSYVQKTVPKSQVVSKTEKRVGFKKSKEKRKSKFCNLEEEAEMLILKNEKLRQKIIELEKMTKEMKAKLVASIAGINPTCSLN